MLHHTIQQLRISAIGAALVALFCLCSVSDLQLTGGTTTETTNGRLVGSIVDRNGRRAPHTQVYLLPSNYNPLTDYAKLRSDTTDATGAYEFSRVDTGYYSVQALELDQRTRTLATGIAVAGDTVSAPLLVLQEPGSVKIRVPRNIDNQRAYLFVSGTTLVAFLGDNGGYVVLDSVPAGKLPPLFLARLDTSTAPQKQMDTMFVHTNEMTLVEFTGWPYAKRLVLNTTASGAGVSGTTIGFPVLVRLTADNFDFSQAKNDGADLRFTKINGTPLAFETERFDPALRQAALWVRVDTVYGDNSTQAIVMLWGNPNAVAASSSIAVFDTAAGFQGVWHLGGAAANDATGNRYDGIPFNTTATPGAIGTAQEFNGRSSYITVPGTAMGKLNFSQNGTYSISAWVYANVLDSIQQVLVSKGRGMQYHVQIKHNLWEFAEYQTMVGWDVTTAPATAQAWKLITSVRAGSKSRLYIDGVCVDSTDAIISDAPRARDSGNDVNIGRLLSAPPDTAARLYFGGKIDEVRMGSVPLSADWIRLCFMNQKEKDALIK